MSESLIHFLKQRHRRVYRHWSNGSEYFYRPLSVGEFRAISLTEDLQEKENTILRKGLLHPEMDPGDLPSGVAENLVMLISKVTDITESRIIEEITAARDRLSITDNILGWKLEIIKNLHYKPEEVDAMNLPQFMDAIALVEAMVGRPLVAAGPEDAPTQETPSTDMGAPDEIDVPDMKDTRHMENVADANARQLRELWRKKKSGR